MTNLTGVISTPPLSPSRSARQEAQNQRRISISGSITTVANCTRRSDDVAERPNTNINAINHSIGYHQPHIIEDDTSPTVASSLVATHATVDANHHTGDFRQPKLNIGQRLLKAVKFGFYGVKIGSLIGSVASASLLILAFPPITVAAVGTGCVALGFLLFTAFHLSTSETPQKQDEILDRVTNLATSYAQGRSTAVQGVIATKLAGGSCAFSGGNTEDVKIIAQYGFCWGIAGALTNRTVEAMHVASAAGVAVGTINSLDYLNAIIAKIAAGFGATAGALFLGQPEGSSKVGRYAAHGAVVGEKIGALRFCAADFTPSNAIAATVVTVCPQITDYFLEKVGLQRFQKTEISQAINFAVSNTTLFLTLGATGFCSMAVFSTISSCSSAIYTAMDKNTAGKLTAHVDYLVSDGLNDATFMAIDTLKSTSSRLKEKWEKAGTLGGYFKSALRIAGLGR